MEMISAMTNHLWQSTVFVVMAGLLSLAFRRNRAQVRYWLWFSASVKFLVPFALLLTLGGYLGRLRPVTSNLAVPAITYTFEQVTEPFPSSPPPALPTRSSSDWVPIVVVGLWACGFAGIALMRLRGWRRIRAAVRSSHTMDIPLAVPVRSTPSLLEPGVVGFFRPVLLLPTGIVERLAPNQLQAVLAHELCHVRRRDNLTAAVHMIVEAVFWFHPLVWWISARLMEERERACDEAVLESGSEPQLYAESILKTCEFCVESPVACVSGVTGADLKKRIVRIMTESTPNEISNLKKSLLTAIGAAVIATPVVFGVVCATQYSAQAGRAASGPLPSFAVASIKLSDPDSFGSHIRGEPGRVNITGITIKQFISMAYGVSEFRVSGGPRWIDTDRYDIEAKADDSEIQYLQKLAPLERNRQMSLMKQSLLADRLKLKVSHDTKELRVYSLTIAKNGPKILEATPGDTYPNGIKAFDGVAHPGMFMTKAGGGEMSGQAVFIATLVMMLSTQLGTEVIDKTGLTGKYDFSLKWTPDPKSAEMMQGPPDGGPGANSTLPPDTPGPSLFTAIQDQLGLKLESTKGPVGIIVINHIERPTAN